MNRLTLSKSPSCILYIYYDERGVFNFTAAVISFQVVIWDGIEKDIAGRWLRDG
jgi:hypothetical protein